MDKWARVRWRVQGIPLGVNKETLCDALIRHPELHDSSTNRSNDGSPDGERSCDDHWSTNGATVLTLATDIRIINPKQTATVTFRHVPPSLEALPLRNRLTISVELSASQSSRITLDRNFFGLTILHCPSSHYPVEKQLNILAISGLGGHALGSFVSKNDGHMWLVDSLPEDLPFARIMVYGYESAVRGSHSFATIRDFATTLYIPMRDILQIHQSSIPLIVVAHSLGGLLVKDVLIQLRQTPEDIELLQCVAGVLFFGVPHNGMDILSLRAIVGDQPNAVLLESLAGSLSRANAPILATQRREFFQVLSDTDMEVFCFYETENSPSAERLPDGSFTMTGPRCCLVSVDSATSCVRIDASGTSHEIAVARTHSDLVKFEVHDQDYQNTRSVMDRIYAKHAAVLNDHLSPVREQKAWLDDASRLAFLNSLEFDQMHDRRMNISEGYGATCDWLLDCPEYRSWANPLQLESHGLLWIKGNAGAGKSTLMKFAVDNAPPDCRVISFFFNARGHELERTTTGMYRALLRHLLEPLTLYELQKTLEGARIGPGNNSPATWGLAVVRQIWKSTLLPRTWRGPVLQKVFREAMKQLSGVSIKCYIDALDECDIDEIWDLVGFVESLGPTAKAFGVQLRFCLASRHYPTILIEKATSLVLDQQFHHRKAINSYIEGKLRIGSSRLSEEVRFRLQTKAAGVFMWVVLMTAMLNKTYARGRVHDLLDQLEQVPGDLNGLFRDILRHDQANHKELRNCLMWLLFSNRPLAPVELYHAMRFGCQTNGMMALDRGSDSDSGVYERFILDTSNGLVEIVQSEQRSTVQLIHESVRDFLLKSDGFEEIWPNNKHNLALKAHRLLGLFCLTYIDKIAVALNMVSLDDWEKLRITWPVENGCQPLTCTSDLPFDVQVPFWRYATNYALIHAQIAAGGGVESGAIVRTLQKDVLHWAYLRYILHGEPFREPGLYTLRNAKPQIRAEYILAQNTHCNLISGCAEPAAFFDGGEEYYVAPILRALFLDNHDAVQAILATQARSHPPSSPFRHLHVTYSPSKHVTQSAYQFRWFAGKSVLELLLELDEPVVALYHPGALRDDLINSSDLRGRTLLSLVCEHGVELGLNLLLQQHVDVNAKDRFGRCALAFAAMNGHQRIVERLLDHGADMYATEWDGATPLHRAAIKGHESIIRLFHRRGATRIFSGQSGFTALRWAADGGHGGAVQALLDGGLDINGKDEEGDALLHKEWRNKHSVLCLLEHGADIEARDANQSSPLICAAKRMSLPPVEWLLEKGADIHSKDGSGRTALWWAIALGRTEIVEVLLKKGADANVADTEGDTPWELASELGNPTIVRMLLRAERMKPGRWFGDELASPCL